MCKRVTLLFTVSYILFTTVTIETNAAYVQNTVIDLIENASPDEFLPVIVIMVERPDLEFLQEEVSGLRRRDKRIVVWDYLEDLADRSQADVVSYLESEKIKGNVESYSIIHVANGIGIHAKSEIIRHLTNRRDIKTIFDDLEQNTIEPVPETTRNRSELDDISWSVDFVNARVPWANGYTGEGVICAVFDTGVNYTHEDLEDHMWDGGDDYPNHGWDFSNNDNDPRDESRHGTACAGVVAGDGTVNGDTVGVAPDVTIMAINADRYRTAFWNGLDFVLEVGADLITSSLAYYIDRIDQQLRAQWRENMEVMQVAGIITVKSCGNYRNLPPILYGQISPPACSPSPWRHPDEIEEGGRGGVISVGGVESDSVYARYSSNGPTSWEDAPDYNDYVWNNGNNTGMIYPDISGPTGNGYSLCSLSDTGFIYDFAGTSMAAPHVAGVIALMLSKNIELELVELDSILQTTAFDLGDEGKDNDYGAGLVQADQAVDAVILGFGTLMGVVSDGNTGEALSGIDIQITGKSVYTETTDDNGVYEILLEVIEYPYAFTIDSPPYLVFDRDTLEIPVDDTLIFNPELQIGIFEVSPDSITVFMDEGVNESTENIRIFNRGVGTMQVDFEELPDDVAGNFLDLLFTLFVEDSTGDSRIRGAAYGDGYFWVAGSNNYSNPNYIYKLSVAGEVLDSLIQPGSNDHDADPTGIRNLTWDPLHNWLWGGIANDIVAIDPATGDEILRFEGPYRPNQKFAYDPDNNRIWVCYLANDILALNPGNGEVLDVIPNSYIINGFGYKFYEDDDFPLYFAAQSEEGNIELYRVNTRSDEIQFVGDLNVGNTDLSGFSFIDGYLYRYRAGFAIVDTDSGKVIKGWDFGTDMSWLQIQPASTILLPGDSMDISLEFSRISMPPGTYNGSLIASHNTLEEQSYIATSLIVGHIDIVESRSKAALPRRYSLEIPYPNPFNSSLTIKISLPQKSDLRLSIFNILGQEVVKIADGHCEAGYRSFVFDAENLSSGIYFIHATVPGMMDEMKKVVLLK